HSSQIHLLQMWGMDNVCSLIQTLPMADITFYGGETLDNVFSALPDNVKSALSKWKIILTPGHTPGSVCLYNDDEHILISGDTMFYHSWGRTDLEGGSEKDMMNSLRLLINTLPGDTIVYPAHDSYGFKLEDNF
ncbi:MAG: MBL fold metallo-hydrolase, partial [Treponema sp.]|nr:MBL fold metallo-hydrolase [Treponema sp.]